MCGTDAAGHVGLEPRDGHYALLDRTPRGRDESATEPLRVRRPDQYEMS